MTNEEALRRFCRAVLEQENLSEIGIEDIKGDLWPDGFRVVFKVPYSAMEVDIEDRAEVLLALLGPEHEGSEASEFGICDEEESDE